MGGGFCKWKLEIVKASKENGGRERGDPDAKVAWEMSKVGMGDGYL